MRTTFVVFPKITSFSNPKIKQLIKLRDQRQRTKTGVVIIDGVREVKAAIGAGVVIREVFVCPALYQGQTRDDVENGILKSLLSDKIPVFDVPREIFEKICFGDRAEGVLAVAEPRRQSISQVKSGKNAFFMVVESVEKPGNLGAILRTADAVGVDALFVSDPKVDVFNPNVIRASLGTVFGVSVVAESPENILDFLKRQKIKIAAATPAGNKIYTAADFREGCAIVLGSEKDGLSGFWLRAADEKVVIPMKGKADSLNTSVAGALLAYEVVRQRN